MSGGEILQNVPDALGGVPDFLDELDGFESVPVPALQNGEQ